MYSWDQLRSLPSAKPRPPTETPKPEINLRSTFDDIMTRKLLDIKNLDDWYNYSKDQVSKHIGMQSEPFLAAPIDII